MTSVTCAPQLGVKVRCGFLGVKVRVRVRVGGSGGSKIESD